MDDYIGELLAMCPKKYHLYMKYEPFHVSLITHM